jgi:hypothetical protein
VILVNIFRSSLDDNHETIIPEKEITIKELFPDVDFADSVISVNGFLQDETYTLKDGDICAIRLFPEEGGAADFWTWVGIGAGIGLLFGPVGFFIGGAVGAVAGGISQSTGFSILEWFSGWNQSKPDISSPNSLEQIPQLRGAKNQSAYDKPVPIVLGKHLFTPAYIGRPYTEISGTDGEDQYFHALYLLGYGRLDVTDIKLGEIGYLASNKTANGGALVTDGFLAFDGRTEYAASGPQLELRQGAGEVSLYSQAVVEEQLGIELSRPEDPDYPGDLEKSKPLIVVRHTAQNPMKVQVEFTFNNGLVSYNDQGKMQDAAVSISIQWRKPQEDDNAWKPFGQIGVGQANISYFASVTTITRQKSKIMRFVAERNFAYNEVSDADTRTIELRIVRANIQANDTRTADRVYLTAIRTWLFDPDASEAAGDSVSQAPMIPKLRDKTARLGFKIKATDDLQGNLDALNCIVQSRCRVWNGTQWTVPDWNTLTQAWTGSNEVPTSNPASVALKLLQSPGLGRKAYSDDMLDMNSFAEFYEWCDETVTEDGVSKKRFTCNGVLTAEKRLDEVLAVILSTGRAMRILNGNKYGILVDKPREYPVMVLNSQNVLEASNHKGFEEVPDGLSIKFIYEEDGYQQTEVYVMADGSEKPGPESVIESIELPYITSYGQIMRNGWYQLACKHLRPEVWTRKVAVEGYLISIGDRVEVQDDTIVVGLGEGAAIKGLKVENGIITEIRTDGVFDVTDTTKLYGIKIMQFDGANPGAVRTIQVPVTEPGIYRNFTVSIPLSTNPPLPHEGDLIAFGVYDKITTPALCFGKKDNGDGTFELTLIPYQEGIYTADSGVIPPYKANITTPQKMAPPGDMPPDPVSKSDILETIGGMDFAGAAAVVYQLRPGVSIIKRENDSSYTPGTISCEQVSVTGDGPPQTSNITLTYITSESDTPEYYINPVTVGEGWEWIEFILSDGGIELDRERVPVVWDGAPAVVYELAPSVSSIKLNDDGVTLDPPEISCEQWSTTGSGSPVESDKTLEYITSANGTPAAYTGPVTVDPAWNWIEFILSDGGIELDRQRVPVLRNGTPATTYELRPGATVIKREDGGAYTPATISCGQVSVTGDGPPKVSNKTLSYITSEDSSLKYYIGPVTVGGWDWIEFVLSDDEAELDRQRVPVLRDGAPATVYELLPSVSMIKRGNDGLSMEPAEISCEQRAVTGAGTPVPSDKTLKYITSSGGEQNYTGAITLDNTWEWIEFRLYDGALLLDSERVLVLSKGPPAEAYELVPSVSVIKHKYDDTIDPATVACAQYKFMAGFPPEPSDKTITYVTSQNAAETTYQGAITVGADWQWIEFRLYDGNSLIDIERVPVVYDGSDGVGAIFIDLANDNKTIPCDEAGEPYPGVLPFTNRAAIYYSGTGPVTWGLDNPPAGVTIDQTGLVTVAAEAALGESTEIKVTALLEGKTYTKTFNVTKIIDGSNPIFLDLENENKTIACDEDGFPLPEALPFTNQAVLYRGNSVIEPLSAHTYMYTGDPYEPPLATPYEDVSNVIAWRLENAPQGMSIDYNGLITAGADTAFQDNNDIAVIAEYKEAEYRIIFTVSKAYAGKSPVTIAFDNQNREVMCDSLGDVKPGQTPLTITAKMYRGEAALTRNVVWSIPGSPPGVSVSGGVVTIAESALIGESSEITVRAEWVNDRVSPAATEAAEAVIRVTKVYDGLDSVALVLENESKAIACDEDGIPLGGALPFANKAALYRGDAPIKNLSAHTFMYPGDLYEPSLMTPYEDVSGVIKWRLENAPPGVSVDYEGVITAEDGAAFADNNDIRVIASYRGEEYTAVFTVSKARAGKSTVVIDIDNQDVTFSCYADGTVKPGSLPMEIRAALLRGSADISRFALWSLEGAPAGVSVNPGNGLIRISEKAILSGSDTITVRAVWRGEAYTAPLLLRKVLDGQKGAAGPQGSDAPRYRGRTLTPGGSTGLVTIQINANTNPTIQMSPGDWVAYVGGNAGIWQKGMCIRWNGVSWEQIPISTTGNFDTNPYIAALMDLTEGAPTGVFMSLLVRELIAKTAMVKEIQAQLIQVQGAIYGGARFAKVTSSNGQPYVADLGEDKTGFRLTPDGKLIASHGIFNKVETFDMKINAKGYLPIGFVYFQLRGQPSPNDIFAGTWQNISSSFAGMFFRAEGGNAAEFGSSQSSNVGEHSHQYNEARLSSISAGGVIGAFVMAKSEKINTFSNPSGETRPVNITIRVWKRIA